MRRENMLDSRHDAWSRISKDKQDSWLHWDGQRSKSTWGLTVLHVGHHVETGTPCDALWHCFLTTCSLQNFKVSQVGFLGKTSKNIEEPNVLRLYDDDSGGVVHQFRSSSVRYRQCINTNGKEFSEVIHFDSFRNFDSFCTHLIGEGSNAWCQDNLKTFLFTRMCQFEQVQLEDCQGTGYTIASWLFDGLFRRTPEPGWVFAGQTQGIAPSRHHRVQESVPQMLSTSTEIPMKFYSFPTFVFSNDFFNLKINLNKRKVSFPFTYCWSFDM